MTHPMVGKMPPKMIPGLLYRWMLLGPKRQYVIDKIKKPLIKAIVTLASRFPEPTMDNTIIRNTAILLNIRDKFFEHEDNPGRDALFRAIWRIFLVEYEHDTYYRYRIDWILEELNKSNWEPRILRREQYWKEPESLSAEAGERFTRLKRVH